VARVLGPHLSHLGLPRTLGCLPHVGRSSPALGRRSDGYPASAPLPEPEPEPVFRRQR
jgi:hypothetical protein